MAHETETHMTLQRLHEITQALGSSVADVERRVAALEQCQPSASLDHTEDDDHA